VPHKTPVSNNHIKRPFNVKGPPPNFLPGGSA
jgi:hypothetical protein